MFRGRRDWPVACNEIPNLTIAGLFDDLIRAQLHFVSLHRCSITCNIVLSANMEFCVSFA
jgi:hypothetical protein